MTSPLCMYQQTAIASAKFAHIINGPFFLTVPKREEQDCYDRKHCPVDKLAALSEVRLEKSVLKKFIGEESGDKCVQVIGHYTVIVLVKGGKKQSTKEHFSLRNATNHDINSI